MSTQQTSTGWWSEGNRKMVVAIVTIVCAAAVLVGWMGFQPEGVSFTDVLVGLGGLLASQGGFNLANMWEHSKKASGANMSATNSLLVFLLLGVVIWMGAGCSSSSPYLPLLGSTLQTGKLATQAAQQEAVHAASLPGCYASGALVAALGAAGDALASWGGEAPEQGEIPGVTVDLTPCQGLVPEGWRPLLQEEAAAKVRRYVGDLAPAAFAVTRAILGSIGLECRDVVIATAILSYLEGALPPAIEELAAPDGRVEVPPVPVVLAGCG